ncbi:hypothetical protein CPB84DRAFT_1725584 [Gymnopilus junonius]|uniref:RNB domain-containing protein n=1 Tax=Gymnopilus junonius TaxID=109634 RepID=A0A9P5NXL0_GYMJU|nr:hypothetical protein CPB84DRAFT_1725584 [Gymnopilus junonius]
MEARKGPIFEVTDAASADAGEFTQETTAVDDDEGFITAFTPGTFVEVRKNEKTVQGIVLGENIQNQKWVVLSLTAKGQIIAHFRGDVYFAIPNFISASLAERCSVSPTPTKQETAARVEVLKRLRNLTTRVDKQAAGLQQKPMNVYVEVMSEDPTRWTKTTVSEVTALLYDRPLFMDYYMTHKYLMDRPLQFVAVRGYLRNQTFAVRPRRDIDEIQMVASHIYDYRDSPESDLPYKRFIEKARRVVKEYDNDKTRRNSGPIAQEPANVKWGAEDQLFLRFFLRSLEQHQTNQVDPYTMSRTTIVKDILRPSVPINDPLAHELAIKLGIIAPWQDLFEFSPVLNPWGDFENRKTLEKEGNSILRTCRKAEAGAVLGPMDFLPSDPLESVRHDFGGARVFVIDDASAEELDDGISLERIPTEPRNHWVHIHVADPATIIHPEHALSKRARERFSTYYLSQQTYPLFPKALVHSPQNGLSLSDKPGGEPNRVLTFSVKVDDEANILDYTVRAGLIRNIRKTSYEDVDMALGHPVSLKVFPFGGSQKIKNGPPLDEQDVRDLQVLQKLADHQIAKRFRQGLFNFSASASQVIWNSQVPEDIRSPSMSGSVYHGFPDLTYTVYETGSTDSGSRSLVSEMMKLANRVSSRFAIDHNVPVVRRTLEPGVVTPEDLQEILEMRTPNGYVPMQEIVKRLKINPAGMYTLQPLRHHSLGIPEGEGYARATSPLRRFEDLVIHWQLHYALLGSKARSSAPFDVGDLEKLAAEFETLNVTQRKLHSNDTLFYCLMYLKRYADDTAKGIERPFGDPLSSMRAWTRQLARKSLVSNDITVLVHLPDLGITAYIEDLPPSLRHLPIGTELCVKLKRIDLGIKRMKMLVSLVQS